MGSAVGLPHFENKRTNRQKAWKSQISVQLAQELKPSSFEEGKSKDNENDVPYCTPSQDSAFPRGSTSFVAAFRGGALARG